MSPHSVWKRKPRDEWPEHRNEDLFQCYKCNTWRPWFGFTMAAPRRVKSYTDFEAILDDDGGYLHTCNECTKALCWTLAAQTR